MPERKTISTSRKAGNGGHKPLHEQRPRQGSQKQLSPEEIELLTRLLMSTETGKRWTQQMEQIAQAVVTFTDSITKAMNDLLASGILDLFNDVYKTVQKLNEIKINSGLYIDQMNMYRDVAKVAKNLQSASQRLQLGEGNKEPQQQSVEPSNE